MDNGIILDVGSSSIKGGRVNESLPSAIMSTVVGSIPKKATIFKKKASSEDDDLMRGKNFLVGSEAIENIGRVVAEYPVQHGVVKSLPQMEALLTQVLEDLDADLSNDGVVLTQPAFHPLASSEGLAQMMFETFDACELAIANQGSCALYASGRTTGIVLESGEGMTQVLPIYDSFIIQNAANRINFGGKDVTDHLARILFERNLNFTGPADRFTVQTMKEDMCVVSENYEEDFTQLDEDVELEDFLLPDGQRVPVGKEKFRATEILFNPSIVGSELPSMSKIVTDAVKACGMDARPKLLGNIVLSGGNTMFPGLPDRLKDEVLQGFPGFGGVKVIDGNDRRYQVWAGASVLASLDSFKSSIIPRDAYEEHGPTIIHGYKRETIAEQEDG